ncbi:NUDIX hydrolase [Tuwongella immobilis]|uniref:Nudix hydrolase domain-containing protein n=1 Tax=Tuwongella immobilis TaxID=692036 RepID=A0A6C2YVE0_9BACT|nr:8-oxo-dGTP diphosphatase [Tuwongella immobilis]VIP04875.1 -dihydro-8-oxoguanine-triphosphatase : Mutator mutT protein OS=Myxococcus xanthus (strain DK 1622) GN=mutT PE=3 SV=1: NUDIX [Tuwongella immobilis]VTS07109.1 -dihydro-8-oxoguanine-triphosphatase : Mutator mutT protein OS=Myxococcus xanthus (strain DK 1622) GN=mutT PE=3 SV=1: NUDIX [Tuwongella immobilis]
MPVQPILATLGYVFSEDQSRVLMVHRNRRPDDWHHGKYNGLGGKLEPNEDIVTGMKREITEEAGITCTEMHLAGTILWPGFGKHGEDWFGFLFRITRFTGTPFPHNPEGDLLWIPIEHILTLNLWEGDKFFLPRLLDPQSPPFHGVMPYANGLPLSWSVQTLP